VVAGVLAVAALGAACSQGGGSRAEQASVRVVSQNILHGVACPADSDRCRLPERVELFAAQLAAAGCPAVVALQEANQGVVDLFTGALAGRCGGRYRLVWDGDPGLDREVVATTLPVLASRRIRLAGPLRTALWVRLAAPVGVVELVTTHLASSSDDRPCDARTCPPPCRPTDSLNTCQARQVVAFAASVRVPGDVVVLGGDLNARPDEPTIEVLRRAGYVDTHLAAGNAECDPGTGRNCTSGRVDDALTDLTDPRSRQQERIDYLWLRTARQCRVGSPTGLFNAAPAGGGPGGLAFPSDHTGVQATITCATTPAQRRAARTATTLPASTTAPTGQASVPAGEAAAIARAFATVFNGDVTDVEAKLAALEDGERLRPFFLERYRAVGDIAARVRVRIDDVRLEGPDRAAVTYTLLLDGSPVLDHLPGEAVKREGRWLVSRRTYCEVSTQGATSIPEPCR
jgi:endonuclease/exonuclease/phosphatase family metal-dependent hydrolase